MLETLTRAQLREITGEGGEVSSKDGQPVNLLDRPAEREKSEIRVLEQNLTKAMQDFVSDSRSNQQEMANQLVELMSSVIAAQPSAPQIDFTVLADQLGNGIRDALAGQARPGSRRVKHVDVVVTEKERDPKLGMDVAKAYRVTPTYEGDD